MLVRNSSMILPIVIRFLRTRCRISAHLLVDEKEIRLIIRTLSMILYDFSDAINHFDCTKATDTQVIPRKYENTCLCKGLIALRKTTDAFNFKSKADVDARVTLLTVPKYEQCHSRRFGIEILNCCFQW